MPKYRYEKQEEIPEEFKKFYVEKDVAGKKVWQADVEDVVESTKLNEFRDNNRKLHQEKTELETRFAGIDPEEVRVLKESVAGLKPEELAQVLKDGKSVDKVVEARTKAMQADHLKQVDTLKQNQDRIQSQLQDLLINQSAVTEATKLGLLPSAHFDFSYRARAVFKLDAAGKVVAYEADGKTVKYGKDSVPLTIQEWVEAQRLEAPHLFAASQGGGAGGDGKGSGGGGTGKKNPFKKGTPDFNQTEQMKLMRSDPALAKRFMREAGMQVPANL